MKRRRDRTGALVIAALIGSSGLAAQPVGADDRAVRTPWAPVGPLSARVAAGGDPIDVYEHIGPDGLAPELAGLPPRVYVPNEEDRSVTVIDAETFEVVRTIRVGRYPHHVTPSWKMRRLLVNAMASSSLTAIDPFTVRKVGRRSIAAPYNLYFTPDGETAIVIAEPLERVDFYDRGSWDIQERLPIPSSGVDHADFSADGALLLVSTEYGGWVYRIGLRRMRITGELEVGGKPVDVKSSADGTVFYVANQERDGVSIIDPMAMEEIGFLATGAGAHGFAVSRDGDSLYVSNREAGTISIIDFATRSVVGTWDVGGSPDMLNVSIDGSQLWASNRWHDDVSVIDTADGTVIERIATGQAPHGLTYFPQPGRFSLGHNGVYR